MKIYPKRKVVEEFFAALADWMAAEDNDYDAAVFRSVFREFMRRYDALSTDKGGE